MKIPKSLNGSTIHYAWIMVALTFAIAVSGSGVRSFSTVLIKPLEMEFGWSRAVVASAVSVNLLLFGLGAPLWGWVIDRIGPRRAVVACLLTLIAGVATTMAITTPWQLILFWGVLVGIGGGGVASVLVATVASRWFTARNGLALGILNTASSTGQLVFLPLLMAITVSSGWRVGSITMIVTVLAVLICSILWLRDDPADIGISPYGTTAAEKEAPAPAAKPARVPLGMVLRHPVFWSLAGGFFICGATSNGLIGTHIIPHSIELGIPEVTAATLVGIMGVMNIFGTTMSGWLTDRVDPGKILFFVFGMRGLSLLLLPFIDDFTGMMVFAVIYGLQWFATVPPVMALTTRTFGKQSVASIYGLIFLSHQIGSSIMATSSGAIYTWMGDYQWAFIIGGIAAFIGAGLGLVTSTVVKSQLRKSQAASVQL